MLVAFDFILLRATIIQFDGWRAKTMIRFTWISMITLLLIAPSCFGQQPATIDVAQASIDQIHSQIRKGNLTFQSLVENYLDRIKKYDQPSKLNSIIVLNPNAVARAKKLDQQFKDTGSLLPLHGIPVIVKDNYDTQDLQTSAGSRGLKGSLPPDDAWQIRKLREAGAIVLGKSNMAEWAYSPWFTTSSIAGTTLNPYDLSRVPAGSSGGTAAAVAAGFGTVGLGTDTGNSIRGPAAHCCLVGIRPTQGLTSRDGIVPLFLRNDIGGPMCRTVKDVARVLEVIAGHDPDDPITAKSIGKKFDYVSGLSRQGLAGARIGVFRTLSDTSTADAEFATKFQQAIEDMRSLGAEIVDPFEIKGIDNRKIVQLQSELWHDTFRHDIEVYLSSRGADVPIKTLDDIIALGGYEPFLKGRLNDSKKSKIPGWLVSPYSADVKDDAKRLELRNQFVEAMDNQKIDALVFPTWNNPPRKVGDLQSPDGNNSFYISPHTSMPAITVPMGFNRDRLPAGLQFVGREFSEATLLKFAYAYEQATLHRRPPKAFRKTRQPAGR